MLCGAGGGGRECPDLEINPGGLRSGSGEQAELEEANILTTNHIKVVVALAVTRCCAGAGDQTSAGANGSGGAGADEL